MKQKEVQIAKVTMLLDDLVDYLESCRENRLISKQLISLNKEIQKMTTQFERLKTEVSEMTAKVDEIVEFIRNNSDNEEALTAFADQLDADQKKLSDVINAGTVGTRPVEPVPPPEVTTPATARETATDEADNTVNNKLEALSEAELDAMRTKEPAEETAEEKAARRAAEINVVQG